MQLRRVKKDGGNMENDYEIYVACKDEAADESVMKKLEAYDNGKYPFSWCAFFFGPVYFLFRKCVPEALIFYGLSVALSFIPVVEHFSGCVLSIIMGFVFYPRYRKRLARLVETDADPGEEGGTYAGLVLGIVIIACLLTLAY